ncbi:uncharacterized protein J4E79_001107 [Alternaria viburni]|uniref:uncharacterized protein n=1 Tax=Alternaria viburni TaxID=566460 RepID=UPI0020C496B9|nr:uncharacterized protein J4E79_001107 [Alternaria viburni]KAI4669064.1 hypothetical protein J4E79_001107 [Alternaria viburni]
MSTLPVLPADVHLLILDYIHLPSHLQALCLTSKALCDLARPRLYRKVTINVLDPSEVARFENCMAEGAQAHLDATRSLTLMDSLPPAEAPEFQTKPHRRFDREDRLTSAQSSAIEAILDYFPRDCLQSFRFLSALPLPSNIAREFFLKQMGTLTHVHLRLEDLFQLQYLDCVRTADLWLPHPKETWSELEEENFLDSLEDIGKYKDLERLYLGTKFDSQRFISNLVHELGDQDLSLKHLGLELVDDDEVEDPDDDTPYEEDDDAVEEDLRFSKMHLIQSIYRAAWATFCLTGLTAGVPIAPAFHLTARQPIEPDLQIDFNALLDGSLGNLPAIWITSHSLLAEAAPSSNLTVSSREDRTDKENGLVAAAFISSLLIPAATGIADNGVTGGLCNAIINGAGGMAGAVVGQEAGKTLYPQGNGTDGNGTSAPEMEQGIVPGAFIGSVVTNSLGTALAKSICDKFLPDVEDVIKEAEAGVAGRVANSLNRGLKEVLVSQLEDMGVETARAVQFASQMEETIRLVDSTGSLATAFEYLNRELATNTAELAEAVGAKLLNKPAISNLVQLSHNTLANLPVAGVDGIALLPFDPAADPIGMMAKFTNHYRNTMEFAKTLGGKIKEGANRVSPALDTVSQSVESAMQGVDSIIPGTANRLIKDATVFRTLSTLYSTMEVMVAATVAATILLPDQLTAATANHTVLKPR